MQDAVATVMWANQNAGRSGYWAHIASMSPTRNLVLIARVIAHELDPLLRLHTPGVHVYCHHEIYHKPGSHPTNYPSPNQFRRTIRTGNQSGKEVSQHLLCESICGSILPKHTHLRTHAPS